MLLAEFHKIREGWLEAIDNLKLVTTVTESSLTLHLLLIPISERHQGYGNLIMKDLTSYCDRNNLLFHLTPADNFGIPIEILRRFYGKHGFQLNPNESMTRQPLYNDEYEFLLKAAPKADNQRGTINTFPLPQ